VDCYAWGFAPFHYGRWEHHGSRWGWIPGPAVVRPIYSPAMVAFVGGAGVTAWFPLGPHDTYVPWYHASPLYVNRMNTASIHDANAAEVRSLYNQPTLASVYVSAGAHAYVNRPLATVAVTQASFAAGRAVGRPDARVNAAAVAGAPVLPHPLVTPQRTMVVGAAARAVPAHAARPTLASRTAEAGNPAPVVRPQAPVASAQGAASEGRPLFHQAVPPPPRPSFDEQQKAIETNDPGRPLGPQQMENLRQNRPAGPPQQAEAPHPAPAPKAAPAPRSAEPHSSAPKR
jgi:hypothetical protein